MTEETLIYRLRKRVEIRRQISTRKSVQEGKTDRIADLLEEAANELDKLNVRFEHILDVVFKEQKEATRYWWLLHFATKEQFVLLSEMSIDEKNAYIDNEVNQYDTFFKQ